MGRRNRSRSSVSRSRRRNNRSKKSKNTISVGSRSRNRSRGSRMRSIRSSGRGLFGQESSRRCGYRPILYRPYIVYRKPGCVLLHSS